MILDGRRVKSNGSEGYFIKFKGSDKAHVLLDDGNIVLFNLARMTVLPKNDRVSFYGKEGKFLLWGTDSAIVLMDDGRIETVPADKVTFLDHTSVCS